MTEQDRTSADVPAHNQRTGEAPPPGSTDASRTVAEVSPETPERPESGAHRSGAPNGEVAPA